MALGNFPFQPGGVSLVYLLVITPLLSIHEKRKDPVASSRFVLENIWDSSGADQFVRAAGFGWALLPGKTENTLENQIVAFTRKRGIERYRIAENGSIKAVSKFTRQETVENPIALHIFSSHCGRCFFASGRLIAASMNL